MKYANLFFIGTNIMEDIKLVNFGDYLQCIIIENIYKKMGIGKNDILNLSKEELTKYNGEEYLILPLNWGLFDKVFIDENNHISISPKIIPVFLSMTTGINYKEEYFNDYNINYLKRFQPIGCRDEITMNILRRYGIEAYLNGCLTATFDKRKVSDNQKKILFVDVPIELYEYIPSEFLKDAEFFNQQYYIDNNQSEEVTKNNIIDRYRYYEENAKLIITSRLHVASPAMAMGIPVIFVKTKLDMRFSWIDKYLPLYTPENYSEINWNPYPIEYEDIKKKIINNSVRRIKETYRKYQDNLEISEFYENRNKNDYVSFTELLHNDYEKAIDYLEAKYDKEDSFTYGIWGLNKAAENFYEYMNLNYKNAKLDLAVDLYKKINFNGVKSISPSEIDFETVDNLFILPVSASNMAFNLLKSNKVKRNRYCICAEVYIEMIYRELLSELEKEF